MTDFSEVYPLVAKVETIILVVVIAIHSGSKINELVMKSTFLNWPLEEEVYKKPQNFKIKG